MYALGEMETPTAPSKDTEKALAGATTKPKDALETPVPSPRFQRDASPATSSHTPSLP